MKKKLRTYPKEFKLEALQLSETSGKSDLQIEHDLGIGRGSLYRWRKQFKKEGKQAFPGHGRQTPDEDRFRQLERENGILRQERDILKKAVSIFSKMER